MTIAIDATESGDEAVTTFVLQMQDPCDPANSIAAPAIDIPD